MTSLSIRGLTKRWPGGSRPALDDVGFDAEAGEVVYLLGANGAGKTSLLDVIAGHLRPDSGIVELDGKGIHDWGARAWAKQVAYVTQSPARSLLNSRSLLENALLYEEKQDWRMPALFPKLRARKRVAARLSKVEPTIAARLNQTAGSLSGGEKQLFAATLSTEHPMSLLLLDEPTSALDGAVRGRIEALIAAARETHAPITIVITHDLDEALRSAERVLVLREGRLVLDIKRDAPEWSADHVTKALWGYSPESTR